MSRRLMTLAAILAVTACSGGVTAEAELTALASSPDADLDGAPPVLAAPPVVTVPPSVVAIPSPAPVLVRPRDDSLWCDIVIRRTPEGIRVIPIVHSDHRVSGDYLLLITKSGRAGSSDISQGGPFDAPRDGKQELGASEISLERGAKFRAVLKVRSGGQEVCREIRS